MSRRRTIAVAGNMGSGKSSLVRFLCQQFDLKPFFEPNERNPYLEDYYADLKAGARAGVRGSPRGSANARTPAARNAYAFRSQIFFLIHRFRIQREMEGSPETVVQDRTIYEDAEIFAEYLHRRKLIDARDWRTYRELYETLVSELQPPDLMIYLRCDTPNLMKRIKRRGRKSEEAVPRAYVQRLNELYEEWFARYDRSPTLVLASDRMDYVTDLFDRHDLLEAIKRHL